MISGDGSLVAFQSEASDLVRPSGGGRDGRDINMVWDVFLRDRRRLATMRLSADEGDPWMEASGGPALAAFSPLVVFSSRHPTHPDDVASEFNAFLVRLQETALTRAPGRSDGGRP